MSAELLAMLMVGFGTYVVVTALPWVQPRPTLAEQLRRFDVDVRVGERAQGRRAPFPLLPWPAVDAIVRPLLEDVVGPTRRLLFGIGGFGADLDRDLQLVRPGIDAKRFIAEQLLLAGLVTPVALTFGLLARGRAGPDVLGLGLLTGLGAFIWPYARLQALGRDRRRRILAELPQVARLLALALSAGLGLEGALERVGGRSAGVLGSELRRAQDLVAAGHRRPMDALADLAERERIPELSVLVHQLRAAHEQGLPLSQALEALAMGVRERQATRLLEVAEKGTVKMLFPLALVMFPMTLAVALIPGLAALRGLLGP
jgi:tight adherence protein C